MFYTQLDERSAGLVIMEVTEITQEELKQTEREHAALFYEYCGMGDDEIYDMYRQRYRLYIHPAQNGYEYARLYLNVTSKLCGY